MNLLLRMVLENALISFFYLSCPVFPVPVIEETVFSSLYIIASFIVDRLTIVMWVYFGAFYPVPLICVSIFGQ